MSSKAVSSEICFSHFCVTTILGSANKEEPCVSVARKECWPYACESPWRRMLFNMPSSATRGLRSKHILPSDLVYVSIWWTRERGSETKGDGEGAEKDNDDAYHFSLSSPSVRCCCCPETQHTCSHVGDEAHHNLQPLWQINVLQGDSRTCCTC